MEQSIVSTAVQKSRAEYRIVMRTRKCNLELVPVKMEADYTLKRGSKFQGVYSFGRGKKRTWYIIVQERIGATSIQLESRMTNPPSPIEKLLNQLYEAGIELGRMEEPYETPEDTTPMTTVAALLEYISNTIHEVSGYYENLGDFKDALRERFGIEK